MKIIKQRHHGKRHNMLSALALIAFFSLATLIVAVDNLQAQTESVNRGHYNNRSDLERFDALGNPIGKKRSVIDYEVLTHSDLGGLNYTFRHRYNRYTTSFASSANPIGIRYNARIGTELPLRDFHPYMFNYQQWWGLALGFALKNYIKVDIFYVRFIFTSVLDNYEREIVFGSNVGSFDELLGTYNIASDRTAVDELYAGRISLNTKDMPILNLLRVPGEIGIAEINRVDVMGSIARTANYAPNVQNTLEGASNDVTAPKQSWKIKVTSPFEVHTNATYESNYAAKVYGVKLTIRLTNELTNRFYISDGISSDNVITAAGGVAGVSGDFREVIPGNSIEYVIILSNIPNINIEGDINTSHLDKAELEIEVENNYIIQIVPDDGIGGFRSYAVLPADGQSYPLDVVAVNSKRIGDGSNKKRINIPLGETSSKRNYGFRIVGKALTIDYDYSLIVQEVYRRIGTASQNTTFIKLQSFAQTLNLSKSFLDETLLLTYNYYKIDPMYSHLWKTNNLIVDDDDQDGILDEAFELPKASDLNQNGILDWREDFIIKNSAPQVFSSDNDLDHNFTEDQEQDDELPDTPYGFNTEGHRIAGLYRVPRTDLIVTGGYSGEQRLSTGQINNDAYIAATYDTKKDKGTVLGRFKIKNSTHWIKDQIWNPVKDAKNSLTGSSTESRPDNLLFKDSIRNRIIFSQFKKFSRYFGIENNFSVDQNFAFHNETNIYTRSLLLSKINITLPVIAKIINWENNLIFVKEIDSNTNDPKGIFNKDNNKFYLLSFFDLFPAKSGKEGIKIGAQYQSSFSVVDETRNFEETSYIMQIRLSSNSTYVGVIRYAERRLLYDLSIDEKDLSSSFSFQVNVYQ